MSPLRAVGGTGCPGDASEEKTTSLAAATPDGTPATVTPALRKSRRFVFMFEPPKYLLPVLIWPSAGYSIGLTIHYGAHSAAEPQPKKEKGDLTTKDTKSTKFMRKNIG